MSLVVTDAHGQIRDWRNRWTFGQMLKRLHISFNEQGLIDLETYMIDSTTVRDPGIFLCWKKWGPEER